jgi:hypothetical protein
LSQALKQEQLNSLNGSSVSHKAKSFRICYDHTRKDFWAPNSREGWVLINAADVKRWLEERGCRSKAKGDEQISEIGMILNCIQREWDVEYAGSLAGYFKGIYEINGKRILVKDSPRLIEAKHGEWPLLRGIIRNMLGDEQQLYLFGWIKFGFEALASGKRRVGQAMAFVGPADCGKSLLQNLLTDIFGGRSAKPHAFMSGATNFNGDLFCAEHLMIEDETSSTDIRARRNFGTRIKDITANTTNSCQAKHRQAITLDPFWRLSISVNDEPENLMILPPIDDSLQDKIILLKADRHPMPMPSVSDQEREAFIGALRAELPAFLYFLIHEWQMPPDLVSQRYGITHFHHPDILEALGTLAPETQLLEIIDTELFGSVASGTWEGSAIELQRELTKDPSSVRQEARQLLSFRVACGTYLGRLQKLCPERFKSEHTRKGNIWTIEPP